MPAARAPDGRYVGVDAAPISGNGDGDVVLAYAYLLIMRGAGARSTRWSRAIRTRRSRRSCTTRAARRGASAVVGCGPPSCSAVAADQHRFRRLLPVLPLAAERLPLDGARVVISSSSVFAHGVRPALGSVHVCHSPFRYVWHERRRTVSGAPAPARPALDAVLERVRRWDVRASRRVTAYVANSALTRHRIADFCGREATVVPVDVDRFAGDPDPEDYFLVVGEMTTHKNTELALAAAQRAGVEVKVVGDGPDLPRLQRESPRAAFLGRVDDSGLIEFYAGCRALVVPAIEEFGIKMVEAQASGRLVAAAAGGGAREIVTDGVTDALFAPRNDEALTEALRDIDWGSFDVARLKGSAARFSYSEFRRKLQEAIARALHSARREAGIASRACRGASSIPAPSGCRSAGCVNA